jgi:hypothetical protein
MANLSSPPSPVSTSSDISKMSLNPSSSLYLYQLEQLKLMQQNQTLPDLSLLYQNPTILYTANPFWWQQLIFSLPPAFGNNFKQLMQHQIKQESAVLTKNEPLNRDYILTPETPEREEENYDIDMDEPIDLSKKDFQQETITSSLPLTPKLNSNLFSSIWSPASLVSQTEKSFGMKSESIENSPTTPKLKFNFDNIRSMSAKKETTHFNYEVLKKNCTDMFLINNNNNNNLTFNNNLNASFSGGDTSNILEKTPKISRKSLPIIKPDSTEHSEYLVHEYRDERGKKERSFEVS